MGENDKAQEGRGDDLNAEFKPFYWVFNSLVQKSPGILATISIPDTIFLDTQMKRIKKWFYTDQTGRIEEVARRVQSIDLVWERFSKLNNLFSQTKASFKSKCPTEYLKYNSPNAQAKGDQRLFAQIIYLRGKVEVLTLKEFGLLLDGIFTGGDFVYNNIAAIQAYRSPTVTREIYSHMLEYKDGRYYSVIKNEGGKKVFDIALEKQLLVNTKIVINCIETCRRHTVGCIELEYLKDTLDRIWLISSRYCYASFYNFIQKTICKAPIVESSQYLKNFAKVAVRLPHHKIQDTSSLKSLPKAIIEEKGMDPHSKSLKWPSKLLNIHSTRLIKKNPPKESKLRRHKLQEISTPRINNIPINAQNPHNNPLREGLVVVSDMAINQYMPFAKSSSAARIFFGSRQDIGHTRAYSGTPQGRFTPRTLQSRPFLTPFNWHTRNLVNAPQGLNVNIHSPFGAGNHMVPKCAGSFCAYSRIRGNTNQYRRISTSYLELAKDYENVIEYFFSDNEDLQNILGSEGEKLVSESGMKGGSEISVKGGVEGQPLNISVSVKNLTSPYLDTHSHTVLVCGRCYFMYSMLKSVSRQKIDTT